MNEQKPPKKLAIALVGFGNVGSRVYEIVTRNSDLILRDTGCEVAVAHVIDPDERKTAALPAHIVGKSLSDIREVDLAVVTSAGVKSSLENILHFLNLPCPVVTSSIAALVWNIEEIFRTADKNGVDVYFEATVGGGTPIVEQIRRGFASLGIDEVCGIVNGSTNYILTSMLDNLKGVDELRSEVYSKGFSTKEARESMEGMGTAVKMAILAGLAFHAWVDIKKVKWEGIGRIQVSDMAYAKEFGYQIRHIGTARRAERGVLVRAEPMLVPEGSSLANVKEENNLIIIKGKNIGEQVFQGSGAGGLSTAISVVCDIIEVIRNLSLGIKKRYSYQYKPETLVSGPDQEYPFYLRAVSRNITLFEKNLKEAFKRNNISTMKEIKNEEKQAGEIAVITSIVKEKNFEDIIKAFRGPAEQAEHLIYLPILLK